MSARQLIRDLQERMGRSIIGQDHIVERLREVGEGMGVEMGGVA